MYYDLIGLPPTPKEVDAYVSKKNPTKFNQLVDQLLSPLITEKNGEGIGLILFATPKPMDMKGMEISRRHGATGIM